MLDTTVKFFSSTMQGAPALSGTAGTLISLLDACLINGFGSVTVNSLIVTDEIATITVSTGHGFSMLGDTGAVILIDGATPSALNGEWRLASVSNATTCTFTCPGIADGSATGTITAKRAPAGWAKPHSGTNKAAYARTALGATAHLLRVDDTPTQYPVLRMYESMTDVDTGLNSSGIDQYTYKSSVISTLARPWRLIADDRLFWLFTDPVANGNWSLTGFGDFIAYRQIDVNACLLRAVPLANANIAGLYAYQLVGTTGLCRLTRALNQVATPIEASLYSHARSSANFGNAAQVLPAVADSGLHAWPVEIWDTTTDARGLLPGLLNPIHATPGASDGIVYPGPSGRDWMMQKLGNTTASACVLDLTGPWR